MASHWHGMRSTLLLALGLQLGACGPGPDGTSGSDSGDSDASSTSSSSTSDSSAMSTGPSTATDPSATETGGGTTAGTSAGTTAATMTSSSMTSSTTSVTETGGAPVSCENPTPILQKDSDAPSGFELCENGAIHRLEPVTCLEPQATGSCQNADGICSADSDCADADHGACLDGGFVGCYCHYGCETDADCGENQVCACAGVVSDYATCIPAGCEETASCGDGLCALAVDMGICGEVVAALECLDEGAGCVSDSDCAEDPCYEGSQQLVQHICWPQEGSWSCKAPEWCQGDCGRPLLIDGEVRTAPARPRGDWLLDLEDSFGSSAGAPAPAPVLARAIAERWTAVALLEHASIASFARFNLQLARLGAPPSLLAESRRAMADELLHARLGFALGQRYRGRALGPGALAIAGAGACPSAPASIVETLIQEACVGETLAAAEAQVAAERATDPTVRRALSQIARDELRHAALGWRALQWILESSDTDARARLLATLSRAIETATRAAAEAQVGLADDSLQLAATAHGVLDERARVEVRRQALRELVLPCADALRGRVNASELRAAG